MKAVMFPGPGSQYKGMGKDLFKVYAQETRRASEILDYDIEELCINDRERRLGKTQYTQPALYVVNALAYLHHQKTDRASYFIGHSLGEYNALLAAGAFDFETGLQLVKKRGELMAAASGGGMAAVLGLSVEQLRKKLDEEGHTEIDIANYNTPTQAVVAGTQETISRLITSFDAQKIKIIPLFVSAPFHSRYMKPAAEEFAVFLRHFKFSALQVPVVSNVTAKPYKDGEVPEMLSRQIASPVQWINTIRYLKEKGITAYEEVGGTVLTKMTKEIQEQHQAVADENAIKKADKQSCRLGSKTFKEEYGLQYAYLAGAMYRGIASKELVVRLAKAGMLGFLGTGGMSLEKIEKNIDSIQSELHNGEIYGMNLLHNFTDPSFELKTVQLYLKKGITKIEASAYIQITPALVYYRLKGLKKGSGGSIICDHKIIAKVSRPEVAEAFMRPAPIKIVDKLLEDEVISAEQAALSQQVPMSYDICVEADSGGHTDRGVALVLLPAIQSLRRRIEKEYSYTKPLHVGLAGGIGTPQAVACAFMMGADFVVTGSINQCTVQAGISDTVKDILQEINVQDTDYAPAGDMFEIGAKIQVLKKTVLFPARANKLFALYNQYNSLDEIPDKIIRQIEENYFKRSISSVWEETKDYLKNKGGHSAISQAEMNGKSKMALVFRWYFHYSSQLAFDGNADDRVNFQVHTGPSLGSFNQWVKGTELESWRNRHVDQIGIKMMSEAAKIFEHTFSTMTN